MFSRIFGGRSGQQVTETAIITGQTNTPAHQLTHHLDDLLDRVIAHFSLTPDVMAEVLLAVPDGSEMVTVGLRPATSIALYFRLRAGEGIAGGVLKTGHAFAANVIPQDQTSAAITQQDPPAHLLSARSALALRLMRGAQCLGVLNIECPQPDTFDQSALARLNDSGLPALIAAELASIHPEPLAQETIISSVLEKMREKIAFAINLDNMTDTYYQILRVSAQVVRPTDISAGLILIRDERQELTPGATNAKLFAVRAARVGKFNSVTEWALSDQSISRRIILNQKGEIIHDAGNDPDYRNSGTGHTDTSELIVPLIDGPSAIGAIGLVAQGKRAFDQQDLANLTAVAQVAVYAVKRAEESRSNRRRSQQLECSQTVLSLLAPLFPRESQPITLDEVARVRDAVSSQILTWATEFTGAEHGAFVLAELNEQGAQFLAVHETRSPDPLAPNAPRRWPVTTTGVANNAYSSHRTIYEPDVASIGETFMPYFSVVRSEVASPLKVGDTILGVLDVESKQGNHFTSDHLDWIEFLAQQSAFALASIDRAVKTFTELTLADLSRRGDSAIDAMRNARASAEDGIAPKLAQLRVIIRTIRDTRNTYLQQLLETLLPLTHASVGRYLQGLNVYDGESNNIDKARGQLYYLVSTNANEIANPKRRFFPLTHGISGQAFTTQRQIVFNDAATRPPAYFSSIPGWESLSGIFAPVFEGTRISGILDLESAYEGAFTPDTIHACQIASDLASKVVSAARQSITTLLREKLREYEFEALSLRSTDLTNLMYRMLSRAASLSDIETGWGTVRLIRQDTADGLASDQAFSATFSPNADQYTTSPDTVIIRDPILLESIATQRPVILLDHNDPTAEQHARSIWPSDAHSIICVPLLQPRMTDTGPTLNVIGVLGLAHPNLAEFSEYDKEILSLFAEAIVTGLTNIALLRARKDLMRRVRHDFSEAIKPLTLDTVTLKRRLALLESAENIEDARQYANGIRAVDDRREKLIFLFTDLMTWFFDLANEDLAPEDDPTQTMTVADVLAVQRQPIEALAAALKDRAVTWLIPSDPIIIQGGETRARLIRAALFQYLDNAIKYAEEDDITVSVALEQGRALFTVASVGEPVPYDERKEIFELYYRGSNVAATDAGGGIGLFQVKEIANKLGGGVEYTEDPTTPRRNLFIFWVPATAANPS